MEADFDRHYRHDLGEILWVEEWPPSKVWSHILGLPDDSAFGRAISKGHNKDHELLAQIRDAVVTTAHGYRLQGKPTPFPRPGRDDRRERVDPTNPDDAASLRRFFGSTK